MFRAAALPPDILPEITNWADPSVFGHDEHRMLARTIADDMGMRQVVGPLL